MLRVGSDGQGKLFGSSISVRRILCWEGRVDVVQFVGMLQKSLRHDDRTVLIHYIDHIDWVKAEHFFRRKWELTPHMHFAPQLWQKAKGLRKKVFGAQSGQHVAVHIRRGNRNTIWPNPLTGEPKIPLAALQLQLLHQLNTTGATTLFVASDLADSDEEMQQLRRTLPVVRLSDLPGLHQSTLPSELAIFDQIMCIESAHFIGSFGSTFSQVVWEERALSGYSAASTFNAFSQTVGSNWRNVARYYAPPADQEEPLKLRRKQISS